MSSQITTAFVQQYSNNVQMLSQQKGSLLRNTVDAETVAERRMRSSNKWVRRQAVKEFQDTETLRRLTLHTQEEEYLWWIMSMQT